MVEVQFSAEVWDWLYALPEAQYRRFGGRVETLKARVDAGTWDDPEDALSFPFAKSDELRRFETAHRTRNRGESLVYYIGTGPKILFLIRIDRSMPLADEEQRAALAHERAKADDDCADNV
jgi:hypothetical protein